MKTIKKQRGRPRRNMVDNITELKKESELKENNSPISMEKKRIRSNNTDSDMIKENKLSDLLKNKINRYQKLTEETENMQRSKPKKLSYTFDGKSLHLTASVNDDMPLKIVVPPICIKLLKNE